MKQLTCLLLALAMVLSLCPVNARAQEAESVLVMEEPADAPAFSGAAYIRNLDTTSVRVTSAVRYYLDDTNTRVPVYGSKWYYFNLEKESFGYVSFSGDTHEPYNYTLMDSDGTYYGHFDTLKAGTYYIRVESESYGAEYDITIRYRPVENLEDYYTRCPHNNGHYEIRSNGTCVAPGKKQWNCSDCTFTYLETFWGVHAAGEWTVVKEPSSCAEAGLQTSVCTLCGERMERKIAAAPHVLKEKILDRAPGLTYSGWYSGNCVNCNKEDATVTIPMVENPSDGFVMDEDVARINEYAFADGSLWGDEYDFNYDYLTSITIPESVTSIGRYAFFGCANLRSITIPESVTSIGMGAFSDCTSLTNINIPESVTNIEDLAFSDCTSLTDITVPKSVTKIGSEAFAGCEKLTRVTIETGNATIYGSAFADCAKLAEVHSPSLEAWLGLTFVLTTTGEKYYPILSGRELYIGGELLTEAVIPEGVTSIPTGAFYDCDSLTSITLSESVTTIGENAFAGCSNLNSVAMPGCVEEIEDEAFYGCSKLTSIFLPEGLRSIGAYAFRGCNHLLSITIPKSVSVIGLYAFMDCDELTRVYFMGDAPSAVDSFYNFGGDVIAYFPAGNSTWTLQAMSDLGRSMTWRSCNHVFRGLSSCDSGVPDHCRSCGAARAYAHTYVSATCTTPKTCSVCGLKAGEAWGHRFGDYISNSDATCTTDGTKTATCSICDGTDTVADPGTATGHTEAVLEATMPTCTQPGLSEGKHCTVCKEILTAQTETAPALGHDFAEGVCTRCGQPSVTRIAGTNRIKTAIASADKLKEVLGVDKFQTMVVANAMDFPDALSGSYLAAVAKAPILLYANGQTSVTDYIRNNLAAGGMVYILGGEKSVSEEIVTILSGINCERVAGSGRFATSLAIIEKADAIRGTKPDKVLICHALAFADSLSASATGLPILLVNGGGSLNDAQKAYLESVRGAELYAIGGEKTILPSLLEELNAYDANGAERISGSGRELTSAEVARKFFPEAKAVALADSREFPDGLAGGPVAYAMGAPLLLTRENKESIAKDYVNSKEILTGYIIGGEKAVSDESAAVIFSK